jgi:hypothetical protein
MKAPHVVICVHGGLVQDVFCDNQNIDVLLVDFDVDAAFTGEPGLVELPDGERAYVAPMNLVPLDQLAGTDVEAAIDAAALADA